jgi:hypothetical protein
VSKSIIAINTERKTPKEQRERRNVFSDETNIYLIRLLKGNAELPDVLNNVSDNASIIQRDLQLELANAIRQRVLPWFWSFALHIAVLLLLALMLYPVIRSESIDILSGIANIPIQLEHPILAPIGNQNGNAPGVDQDAGVQTVAEEQTTPQIEPAHNSPGLNFAGRDPNMRDVMLGSGGGGGQTDEAVMAGLRWLARVQEPSGAWHFSSPSGKFPQSAAPRQEDALAATAMALLAFQGFGVTPNSEHPMFSEFGMPVQKGWEWLREHQNPDGSFFSPSAPSNHRFYTHALCTIALCELLIMTGDESLRESAQRAIDYCVHYQSIQSGGWRYFPDRFSDQSDVSVTGWVVLALKSGEAAGLTVPARTYDRVMDFLDAMMVGYQYRYRYDEPEPRLAMTAQALLCRILLGWERDDPRLAAGVRILLENPPSFDDHYLRDSYYWFFATQTLYHYGGNEWQTWNSLMRDELLRNQVRLGSEAGSWNPHRPARDRWLQYGRLYSTCMSLYILEVYYRHTRIFP